MTILSEITQALEKIYAEKDSKQKSKARSISQKIRRARERIEREHPKRIKFIKKVFEKTEAGLIDRDGIPAGADVIDDDKYVYQKPTDRIEFSSFTIGGDQSKGGKTKFRLWLENSWLPKNPKIRKSVEGLTGSAKTRAMRRISFIVRRKIARDGLKPAAISTIQNDRVRYIDYDTGNRWENPTWE